MSPPNQNDRDDAPQKIDQGTKEEAGVHRRREAVSESEAQTPTRGEPLSGSDRERGDSPTPASEPTDE